MKEESKSPVALLRWKVILSCGHEVWIHTKTKPKLAENRCHICKKVRPVLRTVELTR